MERKSILNEEFDLEWCNNLPQNSYWNNCTLYNNGKIVRRHNEDDVCFSYLTRKDHDKMIIKISKKFTFYTKSDIEEYLEFLKLFNLNLNISTKIRNYKEYYSVTVTDITNCYQSKIFATMLRNIWEEHSYQLSAVPYWALYAHKTYKELNFLQCLYIGHLFRSKQQFTTGGHTVISTFSRLEIKTEAYFQRLESTGSVYHPFEGTNQDLYDKIYHNKEELELLLKEIKWIN